MVYSGTKEVKTEFFFPNKFPYGAEPVKIISLFFEFQVRKFFSKPIVTVWRYLSLWRRSGLGLSSLGSTEEGLEVHKVQMEFYGPAMPSFATLSSGWLSLSIQDPRSLQSWSQIEDTSSSEFHWTYILSVTLQSMKYDYLHFPNKKARLREAQHFARGHTAQSNGVMT